MIKLASVKIPIQYIIIDCSDQVELQGKKDKSQLLNAKEYWISTQSRSDISFDVCQLSTKLNLATVQDIFQANKVLRKVKQSRGSLKYA